MPEVSVLLPFRDAGATLGSAVASMLGQTFGDFELLVIDDGSRDGSERCLEGFPDRRLRLLPNRGPAGIVGALEYGRSQASGRWIARMDADDLSLPSRLARQLEHGSAHPERGVVACGAALIDAVGPGMARYVEWVNRLVDPRAIADARFVECPLIHPTAMVRSEWLERVGGWRDAGWAEDHDLWLRLLDAGCAFGRVPEVLLEWRDSASRLTRSDPRYGESARMRMRAHFLGRLERVRRQGVVIAGAGPVGKSLSRALAGEGIPLRGFFEVNPRRIGERIHGVEVAGPDEFPTRWREAVLLGAVGIPGGRDRVRALALDHGRVEGEDFWSVC